MSVSSVDVPVPVNGEPSGAILPSGPRIPTYVQGLAFLASRRRMIQWLTRRYGDAAVLRLPIFGNVVLVSDAALAKQLCSTKTDVASNIQPNLGRTLGAGSMFALEGQDHRRRRKLLTPPLHGKRIKGYEAIVAEEFATESASWPIGESFATLEPMMRITLNVILRAVFGADGTQLDSLRRIMPAMVETGSRRSTLPDLPKFAQRLNLQHRLTEQRAEYDALITALISQARIDPDLEARDDILALMLQSRYDDGSAMTDRDMADELLTLLAAGHETTATSLAWAVERLSRHPKVLAELALEADTDENTLRMATIHEVQRSRPVIDLFGRHVVADHLDLGTYRIPKGYNVIVAISTLHDDSRQFSDPERFDPHRFVGTKPGQAWLPFGGGTRRCIGAAFAHMEMDIVLRELLRHYTIQTTTASAERWHSRGVAYAPRNGGQVVVTRK
ncbi:putative cytochrome P450 [Gordonia effusa NBRC 100432]|uniref:Putative cytochrome P450 n=1 Tax=Gordonia effusa NBRC 100432 TaxID=1077974 RepID=H0QZY9_9ACTN|nr:cytochrome P450 [Gordonia effusa]GAB18390.1 putative cytochrome P450 [Gordonia effusa NBRC 100432]